MFKIYKYKRISAFLLTFFMLTNGFASSEEDSEWSERDNSGGNHLNKYQDSFLPQRVSDLNNIIKPNQSHLLPVKNNNNSQKRKNDEDIDESWIEDEYSESEAQFEDTKKRAPKKNNSSKKRKIPIEEISEIEEEQSEEEKDQNLIKNSEKIKWTPEMVESLKELQGEGYIFAKITEKMSEKFNGKKFTKDSVRGKWKKIGGDKITKNILWTPEMEERLKELKDEGYTVMEITDEMNEEFEGKKFTKDSVSRKWLGIGGDKIKKIVGWTTEMEERLKELKDEGYTVVEIVKEMNEEFSEVNFTEPSITKKWFNINGKKSSKSIKSKKKKRRFVRWTSEIVKFLKELKNPDDKKKYTYKEITQKMKEKFPGMNFTEAGVNDKWQKIKEDKTKKTVHYTTRMEEHLKELKDKEYTCPEIADEMNKTFPEMKFTKDTVNQKWQKIRGDKIQKRVGWTPEMERRLKKLKDEGYTLAEIAGKMNKEFSEKGQFTEGSVRSKWSKIREMKVKKK